MGQQSILLQLVETMQFIDEQQRTGPVWLPPPGDLDDPGNVLLAGDRTRDLLESVAHRACQQPSQGGLACPWRPPEDHRRQVGSLDQAAQYFPLTDQFLLPDVLIEASWTPPLGQRSIWQPRFEFRKEGHYSPMTWTTSRRDRAGTSKSTKMICCQVPRISCPPLNGTTSEGPSREARTWE